MKGQKLYVIMSECQVIGVWSNLTNLIIENKVFNLSYFKVYRQFKKHIDGGQPVESFTYDFIDKDEKAYQIKIETLK